MARKNVTHKLIGTKSEQALEQGLVDAQEVSVNTSNFSRILTPTDNTVQKIAERIDTLSLSTFSVRRDIALEFDLNGITSFSNGLWSDSARLYLVSSQTGNLSFKVFNFETKTRELNREFNFHPMNSLARGCWSNGTTMWVVNTGDNKRMFAYALGTGVRDENREFALQELAPEGCWSDGTIMWVVDRNPDILYAYNLSTGARVSNRDIQLHNLNSNPRGIYSDGIVAWITDSGRNKTFVYNLDTGIRDESKEFDFAADNTNARGIWVNNRTFYVSDTNADRVFAYNEENVEDEVVTDQRPATKEDFDNKRLHVAGQNIQVTSRTLGRDLAVTYNDFVPLLAPNLRYRGVVDNFFEFSANTGDVVFDRSKHLFFQWHGSQTGWMIPEPQPAENILSYSSENDANQHVTAIGNIVEFGKALHIVSSYTPSTETSYHWDSTQEIKSIRNSIEELQDGGEPTSSNGQGFDEKLVGGPTTMLAGTGLNNEAIATEYDLTDDLLNYDYFYFVLQSQNRKTTTHFISNRAFQALPITDLSAGDNLTRTNDNLEKGITVGYGRSDNTAGASNFTIQKINDRKLLIGTPGAHSTRGSFEVFACYGVNTLQRGLGSRSGVVKYDESQNLTNEEKTQAQINIGGPFQISQTSQANTPQTVSNGIELYAGTDTLPNQDNIDIVAIPIPADINEENFRVIIDVFPQGEGSGGIVFGWNTGFGHRDLLAQDGGLLNTTLVAGGWRKQFILNQDQSIVATADNSDLGVVSGQRYIILVVIGRASPNSVVPPLEVQYQVVELSDNRVHFSGDFEVLRDFQIPLASLGNQLHVFDGGRELDLNLFKYLRFVLDFHETNPTIATGRLTTFEIIKYCFDANRPLRDKEIHVRSDFQTRDADVRIGRGNETYADVLFPITSYGFTLDRVGDTHVISGFTTRYSSLLEFHSRGRLSIIGET